MNLTKSVLTSFCLSIAFFACQPAAEGPDPGMEAFERNSETIMKFLDNWVNETPDYSMYADDYVSTTTRFGYEDETWTVEQMMESDKEMFPMMDFEIAIDSINLLPGVDPVTKKMDGSVRWYGTWKITRAATDSTEAQSANLMLYHAWVFNEEGKITQDMAYGDMTAAMESLWDDDDEMNDWVEEEE